MIITRRHFNALAATSAKAPRQGYEHADAPDLGRGLLRTRRERPRSRAAEKAWLRIFVVRCSLPFNPPVGGHSCNGE